MILGKVFQRFFAKRPIAVMARGILERLLDPQHLDHLFEATAQRQYTRNLLFSSLTHLLSQVVLGIQPSVYAAYVDLQDLFSVSDQSIYNKLQNVELGVSTTLVADSARQAAAGLHALGACLPSWLPGYHIKIVDGSHLPATEHRLAELRTTWAAPLPGQALVVLDQPTQTATHVVLTEDGQAQERALLDELLPLVQAREVWINDRNFCTLKFLFGVEGRKAFFVTRQHGTLKGKLLGQRRSRGRCETGQVHEQKIRVENAAGEFRIYRRITVVLDTPTRDGDTEIHVLTNLPRKRVSAIKVAELYRRRWTIEGMFLEMSQTLDCEVKTLAYPKAALFCLCLGLLAWNAVALLKGALRAVHGRPWVEQELSGYYVALEIRKTYDGMMVAIPAKDWAVFGKLSDGEFAAVLKELAAQVDVRKFRKHRRGPKKKPPPRRRYRNGEHVATIKVLAEANSS